MTKILRRAIATLLALALPAAVALGQSNPNLIRGQVPTAAQWNSYFSAKQDTLGFIPLNRAGDAMGGPLTIFPSATTKSGITLTPGAAPSAPISGDLWTTSSGLFVRIGTTTVGPLSGATSSSFSATLPLAVTFPLGVTNYALNYDSNFVLSGSNLAFASIGAGQLLANSTGFSAEPTATTLTAVIDRAICSAQGSVLYRGATSWLCLAPGTSGAVLQTAGAAANPAWTTATIPATATATGTILRANGTNWVASATTWPNALTSGGLLYNSSTTAVSSSALLAANQIIIGGGAGLAPATLGTLGTTTTVLHGNAAGAPTYGAVSLTADVSGILPLANGGTNANLTASNGGVFYSTGSAGAILSGTATANQILLSGSSAAPAWSTATYPATTTANQVLYSSANNVVTGLTANAGGIINWNSGGVPTSTRTPTLGVPGTITGTLGLAGITSGTVTITPQSAAGSPTLTLPNTSGTFAVGSTSPLVLSATTGGLTCPTCVTSSGGGAITGTAPVAVSAAGAVSITGAAGQVLAGASPAFTNAPALGVAGASVGSIALANLTSGSITVQPVTGALGSSVLLMPAATDTLIGKATTDTLTNKTYDTAATGNSFSINGLAATANTGTGAVARATSPAFTTPSLGVASATSVAIGGATIGTDALAWTGTATGSGQLNAASFVPSGSTVPTNGMYLSAANTLSFATSTTNRLTLSGTLNTSVAITGNSSGFQLSALAASATVPSIIPNRADATTGLGAQAAGNISTVIGGAEKGRWTSTGLNNADIGTSTPGAGSFTTLAASSTVSGTGFSTYLASPPAIGGTVAAAGTFTNLTSSGIVNASGAVKYSTQSAPAQITANQNDYNPSSVNCASSTTLLINSDAARDITGLAGGAAGCEMRLVNNGSFTITLKEQNAGSSAANRFGMGGDFQIGPSNAVTLNYDGTATRWRNQSSTSAGAGTGTVTSVVCGTGLSGGTITSSGTCALSVTYAAGTYIPTATSVTNLDATPTCGAFEYSQISNIVFASGNCLVNPTAASATTYRITLPVASNLTTSSQAHGVATSGVTTETGVASSDATNDQAQIDFIAVSTANHQQYITFSYQVL